MTPPATPTIAVVALGRPPVRLFLTSMVVLFVELLLIRWIPAYAVFVGFFSNFILLASFLGIGLGVLLGARLERLPASPFSFLLLATVAIIPTARLNLMVGAPEEIFFGLEESGSGDLNFIVLPFVALLTVGLMASLSAPLGPLFRSMPPLRAYAIDIAGSICGIAAFTALSTSGTDPVAWFGTAAALLALGALGRGVTVRAVLPAAAMSAVFVLLVALGSWTGDRWSPYYRISTYDESFRPSFVDGVGAGPPYSIFVSGIGHQQMQTVERALAGPLYGQVYRWFPERTFDRVLVIGAGSGTDVALALARGASRVVAVEIDPVIADLGRRYHVDRPYDDPRVESVITDGRAYLARTNEKFDLVIYALTDSLTLVSGTASVRLESFLFTEESFCLARDRLADGGLFVMYNIYRQPWLVEKLVGMASSTFDQRPLLRLFGPVVAVIAAGPLVDAVGGSPPGDRVDDLVDDGGTDPRAATDDWPFLYLRSAVLPGHYLAGLAFLIVLALVVLSLAARSGERARDRLRSFSPHFFALGAAFLLLETRSLVTFSLLFGTTWVVNALAFGAILVSVLIAIGVTARFPNLPKAPLYGLLAGSIGLAWALPPEALFMDPPALRYAIAALVAFAPIFFANLVFSRSFGESSNADVAFASNLLGAMIGGALEYLSLLLGFRTLGLIALGLYALAWLFAGPLRRLGDRPTIGTRIVSTSASS